jgi:triosephosphate isomerase
MIKTVKSVDLKDKRIIMRVDFNVPMKDGVVQDDTRIVAAIPTIKYILAQGAKTLTLMSHLGDPAKDSEKAKAKAEKDGKPFDYDKYIKGKHRMAPIAAYLQKKLGNKHLVVFAGEDGCYGKKEFIDGQKPGTIIMLENTRFHKEETSKDPKELDKLAKALAEYGDVFVNDAFGTAHRDQASTASIAKFVPVSVAGLLMEKEVNYLEPIVTSPVKPLVAIIGGAKVSSKIAVLESLLKNASALVIGGAMAYTFLKAQGKKTGKSMVEDDQIGTAKKILAAAEKAGVEIVLPVDHVGAEKVDMSAKPVAGANIPVAVNSVNIPDKLIGVDVGPKTLEKYKKVLATAKTIVWNGPVGVFEIDAFAKGTEEVAKLVAETTSKGVITVVGGGDSVAAVNKFKLASKMSHVSTGGGASLELLEGKKLPGIEVTRARDCYIAGNWKMFMTRCEAAALAKALVKSLKGGKHKYMVAPSFTALEAVGEVITGSNIILGAQNCAIEEQGAHTGEVSVLQLEDLGVKAIILGHSERRHKYKEDDELVNKKVKLALKHGFEVILCVGETLEEREKGKLIAVLKRQTEKGLAGVGLSELSRLSIAYEPVWAIGTGKTASPENAQAAHKFIRSVIARLYGDQAAKQIVIQYGGSVKPENAGQLMAMEDIDGALVGGASLKAETFAPIAKFN